YTIRIVVDSAPADWYFNFCDEDGNCYPGDVELPFSLGANESTAFHVNLWVGSPGVAYYRFVVSSPNLGVYNIPFRYLVEGVANQDESLIANPLVLGAMFPNPVKQQAEFALVNNKNAGKAEIEVFNLRGQKVQSIDVQTLSQGSNRIVFNPVADLPNGVYLYKVKGTNSAPRRFILLK
ncbi:MAG: T9SS type A sorting domain-containing protein, partial [Candidatus Cloacimonetes bacterium]|nr:T9SS type A sorting domain-containing protein [Candidatus Cloacimonadota bacterium]